MKKTLITMVLLTGIGVVLVARSRREPPRVAPLAPTAAAIEPVSAARAVETEPTHPAESQGTPAAGARSPQAVRPAIPAGLAATAPVWVADLVSLALDPNTSYEQRQATWAQLRDRGQLDEAMHELEQRAQREPANALVPASLGQLCLFKAALLTNSIADQGLLGMKADKVFDQALELDPTNWDARFWKATAMAHWPSMLNKSRDVVGHYVTLIEQQETQPPQPQFAQSYLWLGKEYTKTGYADYAKDVWARGLRLFPDDSGLKEAGVAIAK